MLGYVTVAAVESLSGDCRGRRGAAVSTARATSEAWTSLPPRRHSTGFSRHDRLDEGVPLAGTRRVSQAIDARRAGAADRHPFAMAVTVNERLDRRLVGTVMAMRPERMGLVERTIRQDPVVHRTGGDEDEPSRRPRPERRRSGEAFPSRLVSRNPSRSPRSPRNPPPGWSSAAWTTASAPSTSRSSAPGSPSDPSIQVTDPFGIGEGNVPGRWSADTSRSIGAPRRPGARPRSDRGNPSLRSRRCSSAGPSQCFSPTHVTQDHRPRPLARVPCETRSAGLVVWLLRSSAASGVTAFAAPPDRGAIAASLTDESTAMPSEFPIRRATGSSKERQEHSLSWTRASTQATALQAGDPRRHRDLTVVG